MDKLKIVPFPEINEETRKPAQTIRFYESSMGPFVSVVLEDGNGLRITAEQVTQLRNWLTQWLQQF